MIEFTALAQPAVLPVDCHHNTGSAVAQLATPVVYVIDNLPPPPPQK
jgi:hypothetical protein